LTTTPRAASITRQHVYTDMRLSTAQTSLHIGYCCTEREKQTAKND